MQFTFQTDDGIPVQLRRGAVTRLTADLRTQNGQTVPTDELVPVLHVDDALVESARAQGGLYDMIVQMNAADLSMSILVLRGSDSVALALMDLAQPTVLQWLATAIQRRYLPIALVGSSKAIQVRLTVDQTVIECHESGLASRPAEHEELFSAYSAVLDLLNSRHFLREMNIDSTSVRVMSLAVVSDSKPSSDEVASDGADSGNLH